MKTHQLPAGLVSAATVVALFLIGAAPPQPPAPPAMPSLEEMLAICRLPVREGLERIKALPDRAQLATALICVGYTHGQADLLRALQGEPGKAVSITFTKCGPEGTVDWDDNPSFPPPHCNRNGWDGRHYRRD